MTLKMSGIKCQSGMFQMNKNPAEEQQSEWSLGNVANHVGVEEALQGVGLDSILEPHQLS